MTFTDQTKVGKILRDPGTREVLFAAVPEMDGAQHLDLVRGLSLERLSGYIGRDREWLDAVVVALDNVAVAGERGPAVEQHQLVEVDDGPGASAPCTVQPSVALWGVEELSFAGPKSGNPFVDVQLRAAFECGGVSITAHGFYDGDGTYRIRFMPEVEGAWTFRTWSNVRSLTGIEGSFHCGLPEPAGHGPVRVASTFHFAHADGTPHRPFGTTCYAWTHQDEDLEQRTLLALEASPFNKVRMCVFPKSYLYNENEPRWHAFERRDDGEFDLDRFDPRFFQHLERRVSDLARLGIEADLILFHPYDRWGYSELPSRTDDQYVRYVVARLAAHANVWWSLANEYDLVWDKEEDDWERLGKLIRDHDPHAHLIGVHQCRDFYDHSEPWVTHCSLQRVDNYRTAENISEWREQWQKPAVIDECAYEGDIDMPWGNITGEEMVRRCWEGAVRGGYVGHGETYHNPDEVLWWSKGGDLRGSSVARIAFLRSLLEQGPDTLEPLAQMTAWGYPTAGVAGEYYLQYLGFYQPCWRTLQLPPQQAYLVEVIDTWNMTIADAGVHKGTCRVELPGRPYMAVRATLVS